MKWQHSVFVFAVCNCVYTCLYRFLCKLKISNCVQLNCFLSASCCVSLEVHNVDSSSRGRVFSHNGFHSCWLCWKMLLKFPFCQVGNFSAQVYKHTQTDTRAQLFVQTNKIYMDTRLHTHFSRLYFSRVSGRENDTNRDTEKAWE